jgi:sarcosine oxidase
MQPTSWGYDPAVPSAVRRDVVVVGLGVVGLAATAELAHRGHGVIGLDRYRPGHPVASSTGASRTIRVAYQQAHYARLVLRALDRWMALASRTGRTILHLTGQIDLGDEARLDRFRVVLGELGVGFEDLDGDDLRRRMPEIGTKPAERGLFHPDAGTVLAEEAIAGLAQAARADGADLAENLRAIAVEPDASGVRIRTHGDPVEADLAVIAAGPWTNELLGPLGMSLPLTPSVAQVTFVDAPGLVDRPSITDWHVIGEKGAYGHPVPGIGYKFGFDAAGAEPWRPEATRWVPDPDEEADLLAWLERRLPGFPRVVLRSQRHPWTMTPDGDWAVGRRGSIVVAAGCSGHAFKFGPALGELVADVVDEVGRDDLAPFSLDRPALATSAPAPTMTITR